MDDAKWAVFYCVVYFKENAFNFFLIDRKNIIYTYAINITLDVR